MIPGGKGGPGVIFWIWITALLGMVIKFYSCSLAIMYRGEDSEGKIQGGPMFYIAQGIGEKAKPLAVFYCLAGLFGFLGVFTAMLGSWEALLEIFSGLGLLFGTSWGPPG